MNSISRTDRLSELSLRLAREVGPLRLLPVAIAFAVRGVLGRSA